MNTHRATSKLPAVHRHVVGFGEHFEGSGVHQRDVFILRRSERVMRGDIPVVCFVVFVGRKVDDPYRLETAFGESLAMAELGAQRAQGVVDHFGFVGAEENDVAGARSCRP